MSYHLRFDYRKFEKILIDVTSPIFREFYEIYKDEKILAFGLESHIEFEPLYPFVTTDSDRIKRAQLSSDWMGIPERDYSFEDQLMPLHIAISRGMRRHDNLHLRARSDGMPEDEIHKMLQPYLDEYRETCIRALRLMDANGIFGEDSARNGIVLMLGF